MMSVSGSTGSAGGYLVLGFPMENPGIWVSISWNTSDGRSCTAILFGIQVRDLRCNSQNDLLTLLGKLGSHNNGQTFAIHGIRIKKGPILNRLTLVFNVLGLVGTE